MKGTFSSFSQFLQNEFFAEKNVRGSKIHEKITMLGHYLFHHWHFQNSSGGRFMEYGVKKHI